MGSFSPAPGSAGALDQLLAAGRRLRGGLGQRWLSTPRPDQHPSHTQVFGWTRLLESRRQRGELGYQHLLNQGIVFQQGVELVPQLPPQGLQAGFGHVLLLGAAQHLTD